MRTMIRLLIFCGLLATTIALWAAAAIDAPLVKDAAASAAFRKAAVNAGRCVAADLSQKDPKDTLQTGSSAIELPAGRYRLHVPLALGPLGDLRISAIAITLSAGEAQRTVGMLHFAKTDEFTDLTVDFESPGGRFIPYSIAWALTGPVAEKNRKRTVTAPTDLDPDDKDNLGDIEAFDMGENGALSTKDLVKLQVHLATCGVHIEQLSPVAVSEVTTDKIVYKPGERGAATATLKNSGDKPVKVVLSIDLNAGLTTRREIASTTLDLPAGESTQWKGEFTATDLHWGAEIAATARVEGFQPAGGRAVFGVTDNFWETAIASGIMFSRSFRDKADADAFAARLHANGYTIIESGFWAPDEFGDFTPDTELFFGGQGSYMGSVQGTKNINDACHQRGISTTVYANLWGGDGPPSFEMMRKHPDWIGSAWGATDWDENWYLMETNKTQQFLSWMGTNINRGNSDEAMKVHAAELVASHRTLGWDGVRYDSYYSDPWVKASTKRVRELVQKEEPTFRWGYNSIVPYDVKADALDVMVGGGNLVMEEGIRHITKESSPFSRYANTVITYRDIIWSHGGHLGVCYDNTRFDAKRDGNTLDDLYLSTILLASGVHPYYGRLEGEIGKHARFALRYSEFIYRNTMCPLKAPETTITFGEMPKLLEWKRLARTADLGGDRHRLVIHLLNAPANDMCMRNPELKTPPPIRDLALTADLPAGATVDGAWLLSPVPDARHEKLDVKTAGNKATVTVPEVRIWGVVVIDYRAKEGIN
ncbi:MAG: hypothetical protein ACYDBB_24850 [Armatimonadota bacterium]